MSQIVIGDISPYTQAAAIANQTVFGTNWTANVASDVMVYQTPSGQLPNDVTQLLTSSQFSVSFVGSQQQVQITLVTGANEGDIITITRQTPADRENLYSNTNFVPSMLNNDFGILTLVDQQAQLVNQLIGPRYNYSAIITNVVDTILPILDANQTWIKNSNNTGFIPYTLPTSGIAPNDASYITLSDESGPLPNSFSLSGIGTGLIVNVPGSEQIITSIIEGTVNQIVITNGNGLGGDIGISIANNAVIPGTAGMGIPAGTTAQRIIPTYPSVGLRYNSDLDSLEFFSTGTWTQLNDNTDGIVLPGIQNQLGYYATTDNVISGLPTIDNGVLVTSNTGAPSIARTLPSGLLIPGPLINNIADINGNPILNFNAVSSAVNFIMIHNNATGMGPLLSVSGADVSIPLSLGSFGNAPIGLVTSSLTQPLLIYSGTLNQHLTRFNMSNTSADRNITFQDASGTLAFLTDITNNGGVNAGTANQIAYYEANGNVVSGLSSSNNSSLTTNNLGAPAWIPLTDGQIIIGSSTGAPQAANLTAGIGGINITNSANSITISVGGGGLNWSTVTGSTQSAFSQDGYVINYSGGLCTLTLPVSPLTEGETIAVIGQSSGGWKLMANTGQTINFGQTFSSSGGSFSSSGQYDTCFVVATSSNTWAIIHSVSQGLLAA